MKRLVTLNHKDLISLEDVLEYIIGYDDKERDDFTEQAVERGLRPQNWFEDETLQVDLVPKEMHSHIYYKACYLWTELAGCELWELNNE